MTLSKNQMQGVSSSPDFAVTGNRGAIFHADKFGTNIAVRAKPVPSLAEYDAFVMANPHGHRLAYNKISRYHGCNIRRAVIMRRQGETWAEIGTAIGVSPDTIRGWVNSLPEELKP